MTATATISETVTIGLTTFLARALMVGPLAGNLKVEVGSDNGMELIMSGSVSAVEPILARVHGDTLMVRSDSEVEEVNLVVRVPPRALVGVLRVSGKVEIGDTFGTVIVCHIDKSEVSVGCVSDVQLDVHGSGGVEVLGVNGSVMVEADGPGNVDIQGGVISCLNIQASGSGSVTVHCTAETASLVLEGSGDIDVAQVRQEPLVRYGPDSTGNIRAKPVKHDPRQL